MTFLCDEVRFYYLELDTIAANVTQGVLTFTYASLSPGCSFSSVPEISFDYRNYISADLNANGNNEEGVRTKTFGFTATFQ